MPRKSRKNVGLIGLGIIGTRVAAGLRSSGFQVFVWNRTPKAAPNFVGSPAEVAELCDIIQLFVADAQALFDVIEQMREVLTPRHVVVCNATVGPEATIEAARVVEETGAHFLDAPFTGSKLAAEKRALVYYIGGDEATFLRARPILEATSKAIVRIGGVGHAATIKVVTNMIAAVSIQTLGEALAIVQKAGLDPEVLAAALEQNACRSATMDMKLPKMIAGDYEPHFSLKHMFKDVQLGIHVANALDIEIPTTTVTAGVMYGALNQGWGDLDFSALYKIYAAQAAGEVGAGELNSGIIPIEDLDPREVHYPETTVPAPPRPGAEPASPALEAPATETTEIAAPTSAPAAAETLAPETPEPRVPSLADALSAPQEVRDSEPPATPAPAAEAGPAAPQIPSFTLLPAAHAVIFGSTITAEAPPIPAPTESAPPTAAPGATAPAPVAEPAGEIAPVTAAPPVTAPEPVATPVEAITPPSQPDRPLEAATAPAADVAPREPAPAPQQNGDSPAHTNGHSAPDGEGAPKPFNFVKRWFVARTGS